MNKIYVIDLAQEEQAFLLKLIKTGKHPSRKINRARILLWADENKTDREIADILHTVLPPSSEPASGSWKVTWNMH